jgi:hypothetical protein
MDEGDKQRIGCLDDGVEVTVLAWRPGWTGTARYRVRATASETEGWLPTENLRATETAVAVAATPSPAGPPSPAQGQDPPRPFGGRRY